MSDLVALPKALSPGLPLSARLMIAVSGMALCWTVAAVATERITKDHMAESFAWAGSIVSGETAGPVQVAATSEPVGRFAKDDRVQVEMTEPVVLAAPMGVAEGGAEEIVRAGGGEPQMAMVSALADAEASPVAAEEISAWIGRVTAPVLVVDAGAVPELDRHVGMVNLDNFPVGPDDRHLQVKTPTEVAQRQINDWVFLVARSEEMPQLSFAGQPTLGRVIVEKISPEAQKQADQVAEVVALPSRDITEMHFSALTVNTEAFRPTFVERVPIAATVVGAEASGGASPAASLLDITSMSQLAAMTPEQMEMAVTLVAALNDPGLARDFVESRKMQMTAPAPAGIPAISRPSDDEILSMVGDLPLPRKISEWQAFVAQDDTVMVGKRGRASGAVPVQVGMVLGDLGRIEGITRANGEVEIFTSSGEVLSSNPDGAEASGNNEVVVDAAQFSRDQGLLEQME